MPIRQRMSWRRRVDSTDITSDAAFFRLAGTGLLAAETQDYVPKLIAAALIAKQPARYGITAPAAGSVHLRLAGGHRQPPVWTSSPGWRSQRGRDPGAEPAVSPAGYPTALAIGHPATGRHRREGGCPLCRRCLPRRECTSSPTWFAGASG